MKCRAVYTSNDDLPIVLTPMDVAAVLGVSKNRVYEILNSKGFPHFKVGKKYCICKDKFLIWLSTVQEVEVA